MIPVLSLADLAADAADSVQDVALQATPPLEAPVPIPSSGSFGPTPQSRQIAVISTDDRAVMGMIELLLDRAGVPQAEVARRLGIRFQSLNQYRWLRRKRPSIQWFARLANACGARLVIEFPTKSR